MRTKKRTGILGGTFDPIHYGHVDLGLHVLHQFNLSSIRYILSAKPPHKRGYQIAPVDIRWKMLVAGLQSNPRLIPDDIETKRDEYSWTINTVKQLIKDSPDDKLFFLSGSEGFLKVRTWKEYRKLFELINFIIVMRNSDQEKEVSQLLKEEGITPVSQGKPEVDSTAVYYYSYRSNYLDLSSTLIRNLIGRGKSVSKMVNKKVKEIIKENDLYGKNQPGQI